MARSAWRLMTMTSVLGLLAGCVALPAVEFDVDFARKSSHAAPDPSGAAAQACDERHSQSVRVGMRDLAATLDLIARVDRELPDAKTELLDELSHSDSASLPRILENWQGRLTHVNGTGRSDIAAVAASQRTIDAGSSIASCGEAGSEPAGQIVFQSNLDRLIARGDAHDRPIPDSDHAGWTNKDGARTERQTSPTWDELLQALIERTRERADSTEPIAELAGAHATLLDIIRRSAESADSSRVPDTELWRQIAPAVELSLGSASPPPPSAEIIESLQVATELLRGPERFLVCQIAFCKRIRGYDNIERLETTTFVPNQAVLLYSEVDHFFSEPVDGGYHTKLSSSLELTGPGGESIWRQEFAAVDDLCDAPRRDFFMSHSFRIPANLMPGRYHLRLTLHDQLADRTTSGSIPLTIR